MDLLFENRAEAGRRLAKRLQRYHASDAVVVGIPRGGVPVAAAVAHRLALPWDILVVRKLPIPWNPEAGFGAITSDGEAVLNYAILGDLGITDAQIALVEEEVREELTRRQELYGNELIPVDISGREVLLVDDGIASGYTILAAMKSLRKRQAPRVVVAAPVASRSAAALVSKEADESVFDIISPAVPFAVADFYMQWRDLSDEDILPILRTQRDTVQTS